MKKCRRVRQVGGGFPLAAIAGCGDVMAHFDRGKVGEVDFDPDVVDYRTSVGDPAKTACHDTEMRDRGILKGESKYHTSLAHTGQDIEDTLEAFDETIKAMKRQGVA